MSFEKQNSAKAVLFTMYVSTAGAKTFYHRKTYVRIIIKLLTVKTAFTEFWVKSKIFLRAEKYFWNSLFLKNMWAKMWANLCAKLCRGTAGLWTYPFPDISQFLTQAEDNTQITIEPADKGARVVVFSVLGLLILLFERANSSVVS